MVRLALLRLLQLLFTGWTIITLLFLLTRMLPDEQQLLARFADTLADATVSKQQIEAAQQAVRLRLGLAEPAFYLSYAPATDQQVLSARWHWNGSHNQYHQWLRTLLQGDLGRSYRTEEPVAELVGSALLVTVPLACLATLFITGLSVWLGLWLAPRPRVGWMLTGLYALDALPLFVVALLLLLLLANPDYLALFPTYGLGMEDEAGIGSILNQPAYVVLPLASLIVTGLAEPTLQLVASLRHEAQLDYILTARAKGLSQERALRRHALRNALLPTLTLFTELLPNLLAGAVVVELIFALPGLGRLLADAAAARDYPVLLGGVLVALVVRQLTLALADWLYQLADPRIRISSQ